MSSDQIENVYSDRAVLVALGTDGLSEGNATPLTPLVDRPFLQHVIECLADQRIRKFDILLHHHADEIERFLGDGTRWGVSFRFHLLHDPQDVYVRAAKLGAQVEHPDERFLLCHSERLEPTSYATEGLETSTPGPTVFVWSDDAKMLGGVQWAGSAWLTTSQLQQIGTDTEGFESRLIAATEEQGNVITTEKPLFGDTLEAIVESQRRVMSYEFPELIRFPGGADKGIWIQRNVALSRSVLIVPPVFIGPNCEIEDNVTLGPNAVISSGCHVQPKCEISNSLIGADSMLGEGLDVRHCHIHGNRLFHLKHNVSVEITDEMLIGKSTVSFPGIGIFKAAISRGLALLVLIACTPVLLATAVVQKFRCGHVLKFEKVMRLPLAQQNSTKTFYRWRFAFDDSDRGNKWKHFLLSVLPGLVNVVRGDMNWVGVTPMTAQRVATLPADWRTTYERCECGLINEANILYGGRETNDEVLSAEIYHAVTIRTLWARTKTIFCYFASLFSGPGTSPLKSSHTAETCDNALA